VWDRPQAERILSAQQKQADNGECNASNPLPRRGFAKKQNTGDGHDCCAARQNGRNRREWAALLKKQKKRDRAGADANAGKQRIIKTGSTEFLIPSSAEPENRQINQDRQRGAGFDDKTAETFADALRRKSCKDLMGAIENGGDDCIPEPSCHETGV